MRLEHGIKIALVGGLNILEEVILQIHGNKSIIIGIILIVMVICLLGGSSYRVVLFRDINNGVHPSGSYGDGVENN